MVTVEFVLNGQLLSNMGLAVCDGKITRWFNDFQNVHHAGHALPKYTDGNI